MINRYDKYSAVEAIDTIMRRAAMLTNDEIEELKNTIDGEKEEN